MRAPRDVSDYLRDMSDYAEKACRLVEDLDFGVNFEVVWKTVQRDLPFLRTALLPLLRP